MNTFEYHQLLKYIYFEGYADSYEDAEYLLEELNDDEYEELCEKFVKAMDTRGRSFSEAKVDDGLTSQQKEIMRNHRLTPGDRLPVRGETPTDTHNRLTNIGIGK